MTDMASRIGRKKARQRALRYGQAIMLGFKIESKNARPDYWYSGAKVWHFTCPKHLEPPKQSYVSGHWETRHECVYAALKLVGVIK